MSASARGLVHNLYVITLVSGLFPEDESHEIEDWYQFEELMQCA